MDVKNNHFCSRLISCTFLTAINKEELKLILKRIKKLKLEKDVHILISVIGQLYMPEKNAIALKLLKIAMEIESQDENFVLSTLGALANIYYLTEKQLAMDYLKKQLFLSLELSKFCSEFITPFF